MKMCLLRQSLAFLLIGLVIFAFVNVSWVAADGVEVEAPYAVTNTQWWTGVAIKNLDVSSATANLKMEFFDLDGVIMGTVDIGSLEPRAIYSQATSNIYLDPLPVNYSIRVSHLGNQELAVTVFVGNSATGGFAYQTYNSQVCCQTTASIPTWDQILPDEERFEQVMPRGRNSQAVLDRETGLVWQKNTSDTLYDWYDAQLICYYTDIGGRGGWRLPSVEELRTLVDNTQNPALPYGHPFTNAKSAKYWPSTIFPDSTTEAFYVYFGNATTVLDRHKSNDFYVRAVRSGQ